MSSAVFITLLIALFIKHIIVVFVLQSKEQLAHKIDCYHWTGLVFSLYHMIGTIIAVTLVIGFNTMIIPISIAASLIRHYVDWAKANIVRDWLTGESIHHWWMLGLDQWIHCLIYVIIAYYCIQ